MREHGQSLVELLAAVTILALVVVPLSAVFTQAYSASGEEKRHTQAVQIAREAMERVRNHFHAGNAEQGLGNLETDLETQYGNDYDIELAAEPKDNMASSTLYEVTVTVSFLDKASPRHTVTLKSLVRKP